MQQSRDKFFHQKFSTLKISRIYNFLKALIFALKYSLLRLIYFVEQHYVEASFYGINYSSDYFSIFHSRTFVQDLESQPHRRLSAKFTEFSIHQQESGGKKNNVIFFYDGIEIFPRLKIPLAILHLE